MRILIIEDNDLVQRSLIRLVRREYPSALVDVMDTAPAAIQHLDVCTYDFVICDFNLRIGTGAGVLAHVRAHFSYYLRERRFILFSSDVDAVAELEHDLVVDKADTKVLVEVLRRGTLPRATSGGD